MKQKKLLLKVFFLTITILLLFGNKLYSQAITIIVEDCFPNFNLQLSSNDVDGNVYQGIDQNGKAIKCVWDDLLGWSLYRDDDGKTTYLGSSYTERIPNSPKLDEGETDTWASPGFSLEVMSDVIDVIDCCEIICPDDQYSTTDNNCFYTIEDFTSLVTVNYYCQDEIIFTQYPMPGTPYDLALGNVVEIVIYGTDENGNQSDCTFDVHLNIEDNSPPTPVCKTTTVEIQPDGMYTLLESDVYDAIASDDNCSIDNVSFTAATYDCDDAGQTFTVGVTVTDAGGNMVSCNATINVIVGDALPGGWTASSIGNTGTMGNSTSFDPCASTIPGESEFTITGGGNNATSSTTDNVAFAGQAICGDGTITAKIESVDANGYGGLMIRETADAGAKQVAIFSNMTNNLRHEARYMTNGPKQIGSYFKPSPIWLRLERQGDWIFAYYSSTGMPNSFQYVHAVMVPMQNCVEFGLASFTYLPGQQTDATFSNVSTTGTPAPNVEVPGIPEASSMKLQQGASLFPNPTNNIVNLVFEEGLRKDARLSLRNQLGQVMEQRELRAGDFTTEWNVSALADGLYFFEIRQEGEAVQVLRLIKTR